MAREPQRRYAGSRELGDDVERFLDGLPVSAHRESLPEKAQRLLKRHAALVVLVAAYLVMRILVLALAGR